MGSSNGQLSPEQELEQARREWRQAQHLAAKQQRQLVDAAIAMLGGASQDTQPPGRGGTSGESGDPGGAENRGGTGEGHSSDTGVQS